LFRYQWQIGAWSECQLDRTARLAGLGQPVGPGQLGGPGQLDGKGQQAVIGQPDEEDEEACGGGTRHRNLTCLDTRTGTPAPFHLCLQGPVVFANQLIER
jgi:hypothetical protein